MAKGGPSSVLTTAKTPKIVKKATVSATPPTSDAGASSKTILKRNNDFLSIGTHCLRRISPQVKGLIDAGSKDRVFHIASFDLDDTLIKTKTGRKFSSSASDWKWWNNNVTDVISSWVKETPQDPKATRLVVIFTNQGAVVNTSKLATPSKSLDTFMAKLHDVLTSSDFKDIPYILYAATKKGAADKKAKLGSSDAFHDDFRKPKTGMWKQLQNDLSPAGSVSLEESFFVGDAAGRKNDFSDSDLLFARALSIQHKVPEDFFTSN